MMSYKREDVFNSTLEYFKGDELATNVWINKYALKDSDNNIYELNPNQMHYRLASEIERIEKNYINPLNKDFIYNLIKDFKYIVPQGGSMSGIGNSLQTVSLSNCFVIGNDADSYGGITQTDQEQIQLMKRRGGVGHDLSHIRPIGSSVKNSALTSTGIVPFMERYSNSTREVAQDGRRGALMLSISSKHPNVESFIDAKIEQDKITGANISVKIHDDFMDAVKNNTKYIQQFPIDAEVPKLKQEVDAKKIYDKIIHNAWKSAEPGILFWDTIINESVADCYADLGYKTVSTNPCIVGDTLVATADGRNYVSIKQLTEEGNDIPVYSIDNDGKLCIRTMRNPRITGYNQKIYKVNIEGGHSLRVTGNHKFRMKDGSYKEAKNLVNGDSLHIMTKYEASLEEIFKHSNSRSSNYYWLNTGKSKNIAEHRFIFEEFINTKIKAGYVIHHKDFNSKNNSMDNLQLMSKKEYDNYHGECIRGPKNLYHRMVDEWKHNFAFHPGVENGMFINISNNAIIEHAKKLTLKLNKRFSKLDWKKYARENNLPQTFSEFRKNELGTPVALAKRVSLELGYDNINADPRLVKTYKNALENGYDAEIIGNVVLVTKTCEKCNNEFKVNYYKREISFCSHKCSLDYINSNSKINKKRTNIINDTYKSKAEENKEKQVRLLSSLKFKLGRKPKLNEWKDECIKNNISHRLKTKHGYQNYNEVFEESEIYNHKVISVELDGVEDVYNATVDDFHNFYTGLEEKTKSGKEKFININQLQCGEIPLCSYDSCRLLSINLYSYVENPFTSNSKFNYSLFKQHIIYAQRIMDDIIDLEIEKIEKILQKIKLDPEEEYLKRTEYELWEKIQKKAIEGRRAGIGITGEGDMLAALGLKYGTSEATLFAERIHKILAVDTYKASAKLAEERGCFSIYDNKREKNNPFIKRLISADNELESLLLKHGRRNISLLTIAPAGTISLMTRTTSGIEPVFKPIYMRRRKINPNDKNTKTVFIDDIGDNWEEYPVFHPKFLKWAKINGHDLNIIKSLPAEELQNLVEKSPYFNASSEDVNWVEKVKMQGRIQKWIDHSISVTVNLPNNVKEKTVADVYMTAWESGCKGITVYRDGSRSGVLVSNNNKKEKIVSDAIRDRSTVKRPKIIDCDVIRFTNEKEKWVGFIGLVDKLPYEIFTGKLESLSVPSYIESGKIKKIKEDNNISRYDFIYFDKDGYEQEIRGLNRIFNKQYWNIAKIFSGLLRHGMPIINVYDLVCSLKFDGEGFSTWKSGLKRMIKKYINDGTIAKGEICPECNSTELIYQDGCLQCRSCGFSRCS